MQCKAALEQINALADAEMRGWKRMRLCRHLNHCPTCTTAYRQIQEIGASAQAWRNVSVPPDLQARVQLALDNSPVQPSISDPLHTPSRSARSVPPERSVAVKEESKDMIQTTLATSFAAQVLLAVRPIVSSRWRSLTVLVAALLVVGVLTLPRSGRQTGTTEQGIAFAAVRQAMQKMKTIHFRATQSSSEGFTERQDGFAAGMGEYWVRLSPYVSAWRESDGTRHLRTAKGETTYHPRTGKWETDAHNPADKEMLDFILAPDTPDHPATTKHWTSAPIQEQGRDLTRFRASEQEPTPGLPNSTLLLEYTVWADSQTHQVVRSEMKITQRTNGQEAGWVKIALKDFHYNETPPARTFDLHAPAVHP